MEGARLFVLLSSIWSGGFALSDATQAWTTSEGENPQKNVTSASAPLNETHSLQMLPTTQVMSAETATKARTTEESLLQSALFPSETSASPESVRSPALTSTQKTERLLKLQTLPSQSKSSIKFSPGAQSAVLPNSTLKFLQSFARKSNQQVISPNSVGSLGNRSPRETYLSRGDTSESQRTNYQKSSFETTRGKNWCAYVHTRLSPTVILDNQVTYVPSAKGPCGWNGGVCPQRSQRISNPVYRMQHKIVTSLEWKCCPGFSGAKCQLKAQEQQHPIHTHQAESHAAVGGGTAEQQQQQQQQQDCCDPAVAQKMTDQMNHQAMKLTLLQNKIDDISLAVADVRNTFSSLEEKINENKGREFQSFLKDLKSNSINDLVKDIVRQQFKIFQKGVQETIAQLFQNVSRLSEDLEDTKNVIRQVNESTVSIAVQQKSILMQENKTTLTNILDLKNHIVNLRQEMSFTCEKPIKELEAKQTLLEDALEQERWKNILYYESFNKSLSKMKEVHEEATERASHQSIPAAESVSSNVTEYLSTLHENIEKQGSMMLQMSDGLHIQDSKINNLTITFEMEKEFFRGECEDMLSKCRNDFKFQIMDTEENLQVLNQTLAEVLFPMARKIDKMNEQLNDLTHDMEILQPLLEQGASFGKTMAYEQPKEATAIRKKVESLTNAISSLNFLIRELTKRYNLLRNEAQSRTDALDRRIDEYASELEDGLNKTMTIINNAIDFIQDNYVLKETLSTIKCNPTASDKCTQNMETILTFIPQFQRLNDSIQILVSDNQRYNFVLQVAKALAEIPKEEKLSQFNLQKIYEIINETDSQVKKYQENMSHLEEKVLSATKISKHFEARLQGVDSKVTKLLTPYYVSLKPGRAATNEKDQALQLRVLNSRFKALETKSTHLLINFSLLNQTLHEALTMCHNASTRVSRLDATVPKWVNGSLPGAQLLQKGLTEFVESVIEIKTQIALSNLTWYINQSLSSSLANVFKSQKQVKSLLKKPNALKKPTVNVTSILIGRTQRNTDNDNTLSPETEVCSRSPCQNGGTCISGRTSFVCACRHPFTGHNCTVKLMEDNALAPDFSKGSYRYAPMVAFFASHTYGMTTPGPILFNNLDVNYGSSYTPSTGKFRIPYLGVYVFKYTIESFSGHISGFLVVDGRDKLAFESANINSEIHCDRVLTGDALLALNYGQEVWLRLVKGTIPARFPPATTFSGYLLYRT